MEATFKQTCSAMRPEEEAKIYKACEALARGDCAGFREVGETMMNPVHKGAVLATTTCDTSRATAVADMMLTDAGLHGTLTYDHVAVNHQGLFESPSSLHPSLTVAGDARFIDRLASRTAQKALIEGRPLSLTGVPWVAATPPRQDDATLTPQQVMARHGAFLRGVLFYEDWVPTPSGFAALSLAVAMILLAGILSTTGTAARARVIEVVPFSSPPSPSTKE